MSQDAKQRTGTLELGIGTNFDAGNVPLYIWITLEKRVKQTVNKAVRKENLDNWVRLELSDDINFKL